jgi:DNA-binding transcriptional ArsR family regulator
MDQLSLTFSALADPTRRAILLRLAEGDATVNELARPFDLRLPTVSKHLKVLQRAGLVSQSRQAQWRPCRLEAARLKEVAEWAERFRANWEEQFQRLDRFFADLKRAKEPKDGKKR